MINIQGIDSGLLTIGKFKLLDESLSLECNTLVVIQSGLYPFIQPRKNFDCSNIRFRGQILYQSNKLQDHIMLPEHLKPERDYGMYEVYLDNDNPNEVAYILADLDQNIAVISQSFYQLCRYSQDFDLFKINGILLNQSAAYSQQTPKLNLSEELLGKNFSSLDIQSGYLHDFSWGDDFTPSIVAYIEHGNVSSVPFGEQREGRILGVGNFKTWLLTAFNEVPVNHLTNIRNLVLEVEVTEIRPRDFICNTVTTPEYLDILMAQHEAIGSHQIHITSETRGGLPIFIRYNIFTDVIEECVITYNPQVLQDYLNSKFQKYMVVNTIQEEATDSSNFDKSDRYESADVSLTSILQQQNQVEAHHQPQEIDNTPKPQQTPIAEPDTTYADGEYNPNQSVLAIQKGIHASEVVAQRDRALDSK